MIDREELERLHEAATITMYDAKSIAAAALQAACENDPAAPDHPDTICISTDDFEVIVRCAVENWAEGRASERDTLAAENAALTEKVERLEGALKIADDAISEMFRYYDGGEMRGSYDGKPERNQLRKAGYVTRAALKGDEQ